MHNDTAVLSFVVPETAVQKCSQRINNVGIRDSLLSIIKEEV